MTLQNVLIYCWDTIDYIIKNWSRAKPLLLLWVKITHAYFKLFSAVFDLLQQSLNLP